MKLEEIFEKFNNASLKVDLGDKIFSLELKLESKDSEPKIESKIDVQEKNIKAEPEETPWRPLEVTDDPEPEPAPVLEEKPKEAPKVFTGFKQEQKKPSFESETGWFRTERLYKGRPVVHYFVDGFTACDDGQAKQSHMLTDKCVRITDEEAAEDARCCSRCRAKVKDVKQQTGETALPEGYTGWARRNGGGNHHAHYVISNGSHISIPCSLGTIDPKKWHKLDAAEDHKTCEICRLASQDYVKLTPENIYDTFRKNTVMLDNPVPLSEPKLPIASDDDVLIEAAKRCLDKNKKVIIHEMRVKSAMDNVTIESMPVYFFTTDKVVKIEARREGLNRNANVIPVKITVGNRSDEEILNPSFDINFLVSKTRKEMRRNK